MITWTLTLSAQQIGLLKVFSQRKEGEEIGLAIRREREAGLSPNTIPGTRTLIREGLVECRDVRRRDGYSDMSRSGHFITERGRFILSMIEQDIDKFLNAEGQVETKRRSLKKAS